MRKAELAFRITARASFLISNGRRVRLVKSAYDSGEENFDNLGHDLCKPQLDRGFIPVERKIVLRITFVRNDQIKVIGNLEV